MLSLALPLLLTIPAVLPAQERRPVTDAGYFSREADVFVNNLLEQLEGFPGLALAVVVDDQVVLARGHGHADLEAGILADADTIYYIASATKPFTALMGMILAHRDEIDLETTLADYLDEGMLADSLQPDQVQLRDLLCHTSGLSNGPITMRLAYTGDHTPDVLWELIRVTESNDLGHGQFKYTNYSYNLFTILLERELEERWQDLLQDEVFTPLGLTHTSAYASVPRARGHVMAAPYNASHPDGVVRLPLEKADAQMQSAGGMMITANDAARWMLFQINTGRLDGEQVVPAEVVRASQEPWTEVRGREAQLLKTRACGAGWMIGEYEGERVLHHSGGYPGFRSYISFMPEARVGVTVLLNEGTIAGDVIEIVSSWAYDWWLGHPTTGHDRRVTRLPAQREAFRDRIRADIDNRRSRRWNLGHDRERYAGVFRHDALGEFTVTGEDDSFTIRYGLLRCVAEPYTEPDSMRYELVPGQGMVAQYEFDGNGEVAAVSLDGDRFVRVGDS